MSKERKAKIFKITLGVASIVAVIGIITSIYLFKQVKILQNPDLVAQTEVKKVVEAVGKLMILPDETPTVATVSDPDKLKNQPFFVQAQAGDKVLIYASASKVILWRPSINKILEISPLNINSSQTVSGSQATNTEAR
jgi:hypothetical protein